MNQTTQLQNRNASPIKRCQLQALLVYPGPAQSRISLKNCERCTDERRRAQQNENLTKQKNWGDEHITNQWADENTTVSMSKPTSQKTELFSPLLVNIVPKSMLFKLRRYSATAWISWWSTSGWPHLEEQWSWLLVANLDELCIVRWLSRDLCWSPASVSYQQNQEQQYTSKLPWIYLWPS